MKITVKENDDAEAGAEGRAQSIRDQLRDAIIDRRLVPGAKLTEKEVGALFDVSRTVARHALQMLAFEGLVRTERNRGAFVSNPSPDEARQIFASRRLIEPGIATAVCERHIAKDIKLFRHQLDEEDRIVAERGPRARRAEIKASGDFHLLLAAATGNAILYRFMEELIARSSLVIALYGRSNVSSCGHDEHRKILEAIEGREPDLLRELMIRHIDHLEADLDLRPMKIKALKDALELNE